MNLKIHEMENLRIEEGKRMKIGQTGNPLDGTWTRPDKTLKKVMLIQQSAVLVLLIIVLTPMMAMMLLVEPDMMALTIILFGPMFVALAIPAAAMYWSIGKTCGNHRFRITDEELIIEGGLLTINRTLIPLIGVQQVNVIETFWGKRYGLKNVIINTAGNTYIANSNMVWGSGILLGLKNGDEVAEAILARVKLAKARARAEL